MNIVDTQQLGTAFPASQFPAQAYASGNPAPGLAGAGAYPGQVQAIPGGLPSAYANPFAPGAPSAYVDPFSQAAPSAYASPLAGGTSGMTPLVSGNHVTADATMTPYTQYLATTDTARPPGDNRSAQEIIDDNPVLKQLGNQSGIRDKLNDFVGGDMYNDADQAFQAAALLTNIKSLTQADGQPRSVELQGNGKIDGFTKDGHARHGTEAGVLQDICKHGLDYLQQLNGRLPSTDDKQVRADGTNIDNWDHIRDTYLSPILGGLGSVAGLIPHPAAQAVSTGLGAAGTVIDSASSIANGTATPASLITAGTGLLGQGIEVYQGLRPQAPAATTPATPAATTTPAATASGSPAFVPATVPGTPVSPAAFDAAYATAASSTPATIPETPAPLALRYY
ncbi:hypothetical protein LDO26_13100 [Luteimonas sp. BDR2-5]|uniref:hypothetical protein n=1 Tax=Proluteimonas luteida TaxID=2878685 RepID=UPI001E3193A5|nr:hypothetical protein [Luteimonas sp. BDR2-5]MCD9029136.1 hypothetical protein [Luteimonas sp. BDR2-5]